MRKATDLNVDLLVKLREKGVSVQGMADRFGVSKATVKRYLRDSEPNKEVLTFAAKLAELIADAPDDYCRKEINRAVNFLRTYQAQSKVKKYQKIIDSIESGAREIEEIAEDCTFSKEETALLLDDLVGAGQIVKRDRGGILNRGRKMKFHYLIPRTNSAAQNFGFAFPPSANPIPASL